MTSSEILRQLHAELGEEKSRKELVATLNKYSRMLENKRRAASGLEREALDGILRFLGQGKLSILQNRDPDNEFMRKTHEKVTKLGGEE